MAILVVTNAVLQPDGITVRLTTASQTAVAYNLTVTGVTDTEGNLIDPAHDTAVIAGDALPRVTSATSTAIDTVRIIFDENMSDVGLTTNGNYSFTCPATAPITVSTVTKISATTVDITTAGEMLTGVDNYTVTVINVVDVNGNVIDPAHDEDTFDGIGVAPQLTSATSTSTTNVRLVFNEAMKDDAVLVLHTNYSFDCPGTAPITVSEVTRVDATTVDITTAGEMLTGVANYTVNVINVTDLVGNVIDPAHDDATFNGIGVAPQVVSATVIDSTHIDVLFNEDMEQTTMETAAHYDITGDDTPAVSAAVRSSATLVRLTTDAMANGNYTVTVIHVTDVAGNVVDPAHDDAAFVVALTAWYAQTLGAYTTGDWKGAACDSDGSFLIVCNHAWDVGHIYTSIDTGANWSEKDPGAEGHKNWESVACDADGSNCIACGGDVAGPNIYIWTSINSGAGWTRRLGGVDYYWMEVTSDDIGQKLAVAGGTPIGDHIYACTDGATFGERAGGMGDLAWAAVASDHTGDHLIAAASGDHIYTTTDQGINWTLRDPGGVGHVAWASVASNSDGTILLAGCAEPGRLYISINSGVDWTAQTLAGVTTGLWRCCACSDDGQVMMAGDADHRMYVSEDSGASWVAQTFPGPVTDANWKACAVSHDGLIRIACAGDGGRVYVYK